ncbi:cytokine receptor common subunit beta [Pelobates fuscus]|uniref:cytokine receptor common subunit beta n=1 Tax=Pelobates fuscus TaxID=191477 RepID=UPI002FE43F02
MGSPGIKKTLFSLLYALMFIQHTKGSALLDSLNCVNDYTSQWRCQWKESRASRAIIPMNLYYWRNNNSDMKELCIISETKQDDGPNLSQNCHINSTFSFRMKDSYSFLPERIIQKEATIIPAYRVRTSPPEGLRLQMINNGSIILSWKSPLYLDPRLSLLYQISYYRHGWEKWEDAILLNVVDELETSLSLSDLIPGNTYLFRIRARPKEGQHYKGSWSKWSKELAWDVPEDDKATPRNLQCEYDGINTMICSWEVRREVNLSFSYVLYYTEYSDQTSGATNMTSATEEKECLNLNSSSVAEAPYVRYNCAFNIPRNQANNAFNLQIRPQEQKKTFNHSQTIQTQPPTNLRAEEQIDNGYMVRWDPPVLFYKNVDLSYQLCYWKQGDPECPAELLVNVSGKFPEYHILSSDLQGSTVYLARVRTRTDISQPYRGHWSNWSRETSWKTKKTVDNTILYIVAIVCVIVLITCVFVGYKYIKRFLKHWEESFPNPSKSKLLSMYPLRCVNPNESIFITNYNAEDEEPSMFLHERHVNLLQIEKVNEVLEPVEENPPVPNDCPLGPYALIPTTEMCNHSKEIPSGPTGPNIDNNERLPSSAIQQSKSDYSESSFMFAHAHAMFNMGGSKIKNMEYFLPEQVTPLRKSTQPKEQRDYVLGMGAQATPRMPPPQSGMACGVKCKSYSSLPIPSEVQFPTEGPFMVINPDGTGPVMLRQVGDYCFFPGLRGSQDKLEMKTAPSTKQTEQHVLPDPGLTAVQAFKVMHSGYFALPQT